MLLAFVNVSKAYVQIVSSDRRVESMANRFCYCHDHRGWHRSN